MSLLHKRKMNDQSNTTNSINGSVSLNDQNILLCLSLVNTVNISLGNTIFDNYFKGIQAVIGSKKVENIYNELKQRYEQRFKELNKPPPDNAILNLNILKQMNRMMGDHVNKEIQRHVKNFQSCIESCMQLSQFPQAAKELINVLYGKDEEVDNNNIQNQQIQSTQQSPVTKVRELIQSIRNFIGEEQFIQLIQHSLRKINVSQEISTSSISTAKCRGGEMCEDIATSSTLSDENSTKMNCRIQIEEKQDGIQHLPSKFKQTILNKIIPCLNQFQENINHIKAFTSVYT